MFELILTMCLAADPARCHDHPGTHGPPRPLLECQRAGARLAGAAVARQGGVETLRGWRCQRADRGAAGAEAVEVAPGVFVHQGLHAEPTPGNAGDLSNMGFIIGTRSVAVIDAGGSAKVAQRMLATIRRKTDLPISHLILTHMHPDHVFGAKVFADVGAVVIGHHKLADALQARATTYAEAIGRLLGQSAFAGSEIVLPTHGVAGKVEIDLGERVLTLEAHSTAHTDNDLTVFDAATGTWFLGDLLFIGHAPAIDGSITGWIALLDALAKRPAARAVPGHGPPSVDWPMGAAPMRHYLATLAGEIRAAIREGQTLSEAVETVGWHAQDDWALFEAFHPRNVTTAFQELEWE